MYTQKLRTLAPTLNFQIFYSAFSQRKLGIVSSAILITINHLQINIFLFQSFLQSFPSSSIVISYINSLTKYFYMANLVQISKTLFIAIRILAWVINGGYLLLYLMMCLSMLKNIKIRGLSQLFTLLNTYYTMVFLLPSMEILFRDILCDQLILVQTGQKCFENNHVYIYVLSVVTAASGLSMAFLTVFYSQNGIYDKKNYLSGENRIYEGLIAFVKTMMALTVTLQDDSRTFQLIYFSVSFVCSVGVTLYFMLCFPYNKLFIESVSLFWLAVYLAQSLVMIVSTSTYQGDFVATLPFLGFLIVAIIGTSYLYKRLKVRLIFKRSVHSTRELQRKVQNILQLKQVESKESNEELYFLGLVSQHISVCRETGCFCKNDKVFDPKKIKTTKSDDWPANKSLTLKYYARMLFEHQIQTKRADVDLLIAYAQFLFEKFRNTHLALFQITKLANPNLYLSSHQRHKVYKLRHKISEFINTTNSEALEVSLGIENAMFVEEQFENVTNHMKKIIQTSLNFWTYLSDRTIDLNRMKFLAEDMCRAVDSTANIWTPLKPYLEKYKKLMLYYNWFLKDFLHKKMLLTEEGVDDIFEEDNYSIHSNDFFGALKNDHIIFHDNTPIIHMSGNHNDMGKILKANRAAAKVFRYRKQELETLNISALMPRNIAEQHNYYIESYIKTGKSKTLYTQIKVFAKDKEDYVIPVWLLVKQLNTLNGLVEYVGLMRPVSTKKDDSHSYYMLFNNHGEVSGLSRELINFVKAPELQLEKKQFNIVMLAPKLIKYLFFRKFFNEEYVKPNEDTSNLNLDTEDNLQAKNGKTTVELPAALKNKKNEEDKDGKNKKHYFRRGSPFMGMIRKTHELREFLDLDQLSDDDDENSRVIEREEYEEEDLKEVPIEFTLRIPTNLDQYIKEFQVLKTKQKNLLDNQQFLFDIIQMKRGAQVNYFGSIGSGGLGSTPTEPRNRSAYHFITSKHNFDSYIRALKIVAQKIAKSPSNMVFKAKGVIVCDHYGPNDDILKHVKITELVKKTEKKVTSALSLVPEALKSSRLSLPDDPKAPEIIKKRFPECRVRREDYGVPAKKSRFGEFKGKHYIYYTERLISDIVQGLVIKKNGETTEIGSFNSEGEGILSEQAMLNSAKEENVMYYQLKKKDDGEESDYFKSSRNKDEEAEAEEKSETPDDKKIVSELKKTLMSTYQSIYYKEENLIIPKTFRGLKSLKYCVGLLFLSVILLNLCLYFTIANPTFSYVEKTIDNISMNEQIRRNYMRGLNDIVTLELVNAGKYNNIPVANRNALIQRILVELNDTYTAATNLNPQNEWTSVLYEYVPLIKKHKTISYQDINFDNIVIDVVTDFWKLSNTFAQLAQYPVSKFTESNDQVNFFVDNSLEMFEDVLRDVGIAFFNSTFSRFSKQKSVLLPFAIVQLAVFIVAAGIIFRLIGNVITSFKEILKAFTNINGNILSETQEYYIRLNDFFGASNLIYINGSTMKTSAKDIPSRMSVKQLNHHSLHHKKPKEVRSSSFMHRDRVKVLLYSMVAIILYIILVTLFILKLGFTEMYIEDEFKNGMIVVKMGTMYSTSVTGLKAMVLNKQTYATNIYPYMNYTIQELGTTLDKSSITGNSVFSDFMRAFFNDNVCIVFESIISSTADQVTCNVLQQGKLSKGLVVFHNYYSNLVVGSLDLTNPNQFKTIRMSDITDFGLIVKLIDKVFFARALQLWRDGLKSYVKSQQSILAIIMVALSVVNSLVFYWGYRKTLSGLNKKFLFYRRVFNHYMLTEALSKEKRIKAKLVKHKLLKK